MHKKTKKAETLVEVIIALFIVAMGAGVSTNLIINALQSSAYSKDSLIATSLAQEGIEAVRNIRDTNWLRFSADKKNCWNIKPEETVCSPSNKIQQSDNYTANLDITNYSWTLKQNASALDTTNISKASNEPYRLKYVDLDSTKDTNGDGNNTNDHDLYINTAGATTGQSKFYRQIKLEYIGTNTPEDKMKVTSIVAWEVGQVVHKVKLQTILTNYRKVAR